MLRAPYLYRHTGLLARLVTQKVTLSKSANFLLLHEDAKFSRVLTVCLEEL